MSANTGMSLKKYTVFFSTDVRKVLAADGPERKAPWAPGYRNFRAVNQFAPCLMQLMLTKPDLESDEMKFGIDQCFIGIWQDLYRNWDIVKAAYEQAERGTVYVTLLDEGGEETCMKAHFGTLHITLWMSYSSRPLGWLVEVDGKVIRDTRDKWCQFPDPPPVEQSETV